MVEMSAWLRAKRALDLFGLWADILAITITFLAESKNLFKNLFVELISNVVVVSAGFLSMWEKGKGREGSADLVRIFVWRLRE